LGVINMTPGVYQVSSNNLPPAGKVASGIDRGDGVLGTRTDASIGYVLASATPYGDPSSTFSGLATLPSLSNVTVQNGNFGINGNGSIGSLDISTYTLISGVISASYVLTGHTNYPSGANGTLTFPALSNVTLQNGNFGVAGNGSIGTLDISSYTLISNVVGAGYVLTGHPNYTGGANGTLTLPAANVTYHTAPAYGANGNGTTGTAATYTEGQANQSTADANTVASNAAGILNNYTILGTTGTYNPSGNSAAQYAAGQAAQLTTDENTLANHTMDIRSGVNILGTVGNLTLVSGQVGFHDWLV
jgi:hypothetical protein